MVNKADILKGIGEDKQERYEAAFVKEVLKHLGFSKADIDAKLEPSLKAGGSLGPTWLADEAGAYWGKAAHYCHRVEFSWESILNGKFPGYEIYQTDVDKLSEQGEYDMAVRGILVFRFDPVKFMVMFNTEFGTPDTRETGVITRGRFGFCTLQDYLKYYYPKTE